MKKNLDKVLGVKDQPNRIKPSSSTAFVVNDTDYLHDLSFVSYVQENYPFSLNAFKIEFECLDDFIVNIQKIDPSKTLSRYEFKQQSYNLIILENKNFIVRCKKYKENSKLDVFISANNLDDLDKLTKVTNSFENEVLESEVTIDCFYMSQGGRVECYTKMKTIKDFYLNEKYYPYLNTGELFKQYIMSEDNILLLTGKPGTGKTALTDSYMKFSIESEFVKKYLEKEGPIEFKVAYVKNENILSTDDFWVQLQYNIYDLIILDDLDYSLLPRTQEISTQEDVNKNKFISNLLSYTDGIFDENTKTKFIITTNKETKEIDVAILRKGRTFDILNLRALNNAEAKDVWLSEGLEVDKFMSSIFKDSDNILPCDLGSEISKIKASEKYGIEIKPYVKEDGISMYSNAKTKRKIGFN